MVRQDGNRHSYLTGIGELAVHRVRYRILRGGARQTLLSIIGIALAIALLLTVTSVGLGLAAQGTVYTSTTDYWIVPEQRQESAVIGVAGTRFGQVHSVTARLEKRDSVVSATPVLIDLVRVRAPRSEMGRYVFLVGVIPHEDGGHVVGLPTASLQPGDPYFANGSYNGTWTGQTVISASAASALNVSTGDTLQPGSQQSHGQNAPRTLSIVAVSPAQAPGLAQFPVLVMHLAEAQQLAGATQGDKADQLHVDTTDATGNHALTGVYPQSNVVSRQAMLAHQLRSSDLPFAMSIAGGLIAIVVGVLAIVTTIGFEIADDAAVRAMLAAIGVTRRTRLLLVGLETLSTTLIGGVIGVLLWLGSLTIINLIGQHFVHSPIAVFQPLLGVYGLITALGVGLLSLPIVLVFTRRDSLTEALHSR